MRAMSIIMSVGPARFWRLGGQWKHLWFNCWNTQFWILRLFAGFQIRLFVVQNLSHNKYLQTTWLSTDRKIYNQIDQVTIAVHTFQGPSINSDHYSGLARIRSLSSEEPTSTCTRKVQCWKAALWELHQQQGLRELWDGISCSARSAANAFMGFPTGQNNSRLRYHELK